MNHTMGCYYESVLKGLVFGYRIVDNIHQVVLKSWQFQVTAFYQKRNLAFWSVIPQILLMDKKSYNVLICMDNNQVNCWIFPTFFWCFIEKPIIIKIIKGIVFVYFRLGWIVLIYHILCSSLLLPMPDILLQVITMYISVFIVDLYCIHV